MAASLVIMAVSYLELTTKIANAGSQVRAQLATHWMRDLGDPVYILAPNDHRNYILAATVAPTKSPLSVLLPDHPTTYIVLKTTSVYQIMLPRPQVSGCPTT